MLSDWTMRDSPLTSMNWRVPKSMEREMDDFWRDHEKFMRRTHTLLEPRFRGASAFTNDLVGPRLNEFFISKGPELSSPMDVLTSGVTDRTLSNMTDNLLYSRADAFADIAGVNKQLELLNQMWPEGWTKMQEYNRNFGINTNLGNLSIIRSMEDLVGPVKIEKGHSVANLTWRVPKDKEQEIDAFWADHEKWMRSSHSIGSAITPTDPKVPRVINYWVSKGPELVDPMNPASGETGFVIYAESETYPDADGLDKHIALAKDSWKEGWEKLKKYNTDYSLMTNVANSKVIATRF